jgi:hypothetical protein
MIRKILKLLKKYYHLMILNDIHKGLEKLQEEFFNLIDVYLSSQYIKYNGEDSSALNPFYQYITIEKIDKILVLKLPTCQFIITTIFDNEERRIFLRLYNKEEVESDKNIPYWEEVDFVRSLNKLSRFWCMDSQNIETESLASEYINTFYNVYRERNSTKFPSVH